MANVIYHKLVNGEYMNQGYPGGPAYFKVAQNPSDGLYYVNFTYNGDNWFLHDPGLATPAAAQTALDNYIASLIAGTAT
jgi:hypothetical protein